MGNREISIFFKRICPKVNAIVWLEFEHVYYDAAFWCLTHYPRVGGLPSNLFVFIHINNSFAYNFHKKTITKFLEQETMSKLFWDDYNESSIRIIINIIWTNLSSEIKEIHLSISLI